MRLAPPTIALFAMIAVVAGARGDALELDTGERIEGKIIGGTGDQIYLRRPGAAADAIEKFDRSRVFRIERDRRKPDSRPASEPTEPQSSAGEPKPATPRVPAEPIAPATRPAVTAASTLPAEPLSVEPPRQVMPSPLAVAASAPATTPALPVGLPSQTQRALVMALAEWRGEDFKQAGLSFTRLINNATPQERELMSGYVQANLGMSLAALAAETRWRAATATRRGPGIRLEYVTEYEKPALAARLRAAYDAALQSREDVAPAGREPGEKAVIPARGSVRRGRPTPRDIATSRPWYESLPAASQPTGLESPQVHRDFAVADWLNRPDGFEGTPEQAKALAGRTAHASSILNERLRLDPAAKNATTRRQLMADRQRLAALSKVLNSRFNRAAPPEPDPKLVEAEAARRKEFEKQMQAEQKAWAEELDKAREQARKWQEEQEKKEAAPRPGLFDWLKPKPAEDQK